MSETIPINIGGWRNKLLLTDAEVREILGCGRSFLQEERAAGRISYIQSGPKGRILYRPEFVDEYLARHTHRARPVPQTQPVFGKHTVRGVR